MVANFTNNLLKEGTSSKSGETIAEILDFYGSSLILNSERDRATVGFYCLEKHLDALLPLLEEILKSPTFPEEEVEMHASRQKQEFEVNLQKVGYLASRRFNEMLFGPNHPYGKSASFEDYDLIQRSHLTDFWSQYYHAGNCDIIISGGHQDLLIPKLEHHLGGNDWIREHNHTKITIDPDFTFESGDYIVKGDAVQSAIRMGKPMVMQSHPDFATLKVLNTLLGGYFGSRLMKNIREDNGFTYGINSMLLSFERAGCLVIASEVGAGHAGETIAEIIKEIDILRTIPVSNTELNLVKNYMLGNFIRSVDGPFDAAEKFKDSLMMGLPNDYYSNYLETVQHTSPQVIMEKANEYLVPASFMELIVGQEDIKKIKN